MQIKCYVKEKFEEWYKPQCQWTMCKLYYDFEVLCHAYCHACLIFVRYQSWLFHSSSKNVSYIKAATSTLTRRGTSLKSPCHTTTRFEISAQCAKQSRRQLVFFLAQVTFFYLVNNFQKVLQMCLPQRRHEKLIPSSLSNRLHSFFVFHLCSSSVGL